MGGLPLEKEEDAMNPKRKPLSLTSRGLMAVLCTVVLVPGDALSNLRARPAQQAQATSSEAAAPKIPPEQLDSLVAPIALYPDPMLAQVLAASTYPLEIIQLQQWLTKNPKLKDKALADAVAKQPWDASVQAMAAMPDVVKRLADDIQWATDLGNAFLAQQSDVMDAVQRMRKKAKDNGNLKTGEQQKVETKVVESKSVIVIEQANPQVVYVPSYNPTVVYGPPVYPYPPVYYPPPPSTGAVVAGMAISFGVGMAMGAAWGGGWGWGCGWGNNDVDINVNNNFNRNTNINNRQANVSGNRGGGNTWQHNPQHRGGAPYSNQATASKYGGTTRGASPSSRQASARQQIGSQGGNLASSRGGAGVSDRSAGGAGNRAGGAGVSDRSAGGGAGSRAGGAGVSDRSAGGAGSRSGGGGGERIGSRDMSSSGGGNRSAFGGGSGGYSGSSARASSSRGSSSMSSRGGGSRGGGGRRR